MVPQLSLLRSFPLLQESSEVCHQQKARRSERAFCLRAAPMGWPIALQPLRVLKVSMGRQQTVLANSMVPLKEDTSFLSDDLRCPAE